MFCLGIVMPWLRGPVDSYVSQLPRIMCYNCIVIVSTSGAGLLRFLQGLIYSYVCYST